jgi:hypothetical protein
MGDFMGRAVWTRQSRVAALLRCLPRRLVRSAAKAESESVTAALDDFVGQVKAETTPFAAAELHATRAPKREGRALFIGAVLGAFISGCAITLALTAGLPKLASSSTDSPAFTSHRADATASVTLPR